MKKHIIAITFGLLASPLVLADMDHSRHQGMKMDTANTQNMDCSNPVHAKMAECNAQKKAAASMDHSKHTMPMTEPVTGTEMKMDHSKHSKPMGKSMQDHSMNNTSMKMDHSTMKHQSSIPVSDGSLDHDVPFPYPAEKMEDDPILTKFMLDQLEVHDANGDNPVTWEAEAWIGKDFNKLWFKTEGERVNGDNEELELQALYSHAIAPYWDVQAGVRKDFKPTGREWAVIGLKGLAPYFFETDLALFAGDKGRTAARIQSEYELLFTQKTILTPEIELNLYGKNDPEMRIGSGLADARVGLRLRHEFRREFAPYIGVEWTKKFGDTADFARADGVDVSDTQFVTGIRAWF